MIIPDRVTHAYGKEVDLHATCFFFSLTLYFLYIKDLGFLKIIVECAAVRLSVLEDSE